MRKQNCLSDSFGSALSHLSDVGFRGLCPIISDNFPKPTIRHSRYDWPAVRRWESTPGLNFSLSPSFFISYTTICCTFHVHNRVQYNECLPGEIVSKCAPLSSLSDTASHASLWRPAFNSIFECARLDQVHTHTFDFSHGLTSRTNHFFSKYNPAPQKTDCCSNNLCTLTITGDTASTTVLVHLNWYAELLMDNLAEHENAVALLQIRSDEFSMNLRSMPVPAYWCDVVTGWHMITKHEMQYDTGRKESLLCILLKHRCCHTKAIQQYGNTLTYW